MTDRHEACPSCAGTNFGIGALGGCRTCGSSNPPGADFHPATVASVTSKGSPKEIVRISEATRDALVERAAAEGVSKSDIMRRAIEKELGIDPTPATEASTRPSLVASILSAPNPDGFDDMSPDYRMGYNDAMGSAAQVAMFSREWGGE